MGGCAPNPCGTPDGNQELAIEIFRSVYQRGERVWGRAVFAAKCSVIARFPDNDHYYGNAYLYTLFGDPALRLKCRATTGVREKPAGVVLRAAPKHATVVTGTLHLPPESTETWFLDISGRPVITLEPGANDISQLAPGVYFLARKDPKGQGFEGPSARMVVIQR